MQLKNLHPAALKEIERAMKNDLKKRAGGDRLNEERKFTNEDYHKKAAAAKEKHPGEDHDRSGRHDRRADLHGNVDRIGDPDIGKTMPGNGG